MHMKKSTGVRFIIMFVSLVSIALSLFISNQLQSDEMHAAATTTNVNVSQVEFVSIDGTTPSAYVVSTIGEVYYSSDSTSIPFAAIKLSNGEKLGNIKKVATHNYVNRSDRGLNGDITYALSNDGLLYSLNQTSNASLVNTSLSGNIIDVQVGQYNTYLIMENGDMYALGENGSGSLGDGTNVPKTAFTRVNISNVKQFQVHFDSCFAVDGSGYLWSWGRYGYGTGINNNPTPTRVKNSDGTEFTTKVKLLSDPVVGTAVSYYLSPLESAGISFIGEDNKLYYMKNSDADFFGANSIYPVEATFSYPDLSNAKHMTNGFYNFTVTMNDRLYTITSPTVLSWNTIDSNSNQRDSINNFIPYVSTDTITAANKILNGGQTYYTSWVICDEDKLFIKGQPAQFTIDLDVTAQTLGSNEYFDSQKYDSDIIIDVTKSSDYSAYEIKYKYKNLLTNETSVEATYDEFNDFKVIATSGSRIYREYKFYIEGKETETEVYFTVDLYKHPFENVKIGEDPVVNSEHYPTDSRITWDSTNGLVNNVTTAKLTLPIPEGSPTGTVAEKKEITSGYDLGTTTGEYSLNIKDSYGNLFAVSFTIDAIASPTGVLLNDAGSFVYNSDVTKANARLGELTLKYAEGDKANEITELAIYSGDTNGNFRVEQDTESQKWYLVANKTIPAGDYSLNFTGKAGRRFTKQLKNRDDDSVRIIRIAKADNAMTWNDATKSAIADGKFVDETITLGVDDKPAEIGSVTFSIETAVPGVNIDPTTGVITITSITGNSQVINIVAKTAATTNYKATELKGAITLSKRTINLKTVIVGTDSVVKDNLIFELGSPLPSFNIKETVTLPNGVVLNDVRPDNYKIILKGDASETAVTTIINEGIYEIKPIYNSNVAANKYNLNYTSYATITAEKVSIDDSNASAYYTLTLEGTGTVYTPGTWTNKNIVITPKNATYTQMKVDTGSYTTTSQTYRKAGTNSVVLTFRTAQGIETSTTIYNIQIDKEKPTMDAYVYSETNTSTFANFMRTISFDHFFSKEQIVTFTAQDKDSGIEKYHYKITEVDNEMNDLNVYKDMDGASETLKNNKNYKIVAYAIDNAGNQSDESTEYVQINDVAPSIEIDAKIANTTTAYNEKWTSKGIDISLSSGSEIKQYAVSEDGITFTDLLGTTYKIPNTSNINNKTYIFKGTSHTDVAGSKSIKIKIDKDIPTFKLAATTNDGNTYDGTKTEKDVTITLSQDVGKENISGVDYYYCTNAMIKDNNPFTNPTGWTKISGTQQTFNADTNETYYFKAVSGAGEASVDVEPQIINIKKLVDNPDSLQWQTPGDQTVTYGSSIPLTIMNEGKEVAVDEITITKSGGSDCLTYDPATRRVTAISGTCATNPMTIQAMVGNYRDPLVKTIRVQKADLQLQSKFVVNGATTNTANILKDGTVPSLSVDFVSGKGLVGSDASSVVKASDLGTFTPEYATSDGTIIPDFNTSATGNYKVKNKLNVGTVNGITSFTSKYNVDTLAGVLVIGDNNIPDSDLYTITGGSKTSVDNEWYTAKVTIQPKHAIFTKMGIGSDTPKTGDQIYPATDNIDGVNDVTLTFEDASSNRITKSPTIKIDSVIPDVNVVASSNGSSYDGNKTEENVTITLSQPVNNISLVTYYYCTDLTTSASSPTGSGWTKVNGSTLILDSSQNKTYYFKAVSGAGLMSTTAKTQKIEIEKKESNPVDMDWAPGIKDDLAYGDSITLQINNTHGKPITYTSTGGDDCLSLDKGTGSVTAKSGVCLNGDMEVTAQVGNYALPLKKTFSVHKVNLDFQTIFISDDSITKTIFKGDSEPAVKVKLINGTSLAGTEASMKINDIGTYTSTYSLNGGNATIGINTDTIGEYKITNKLSTDSVTITDFNSKYTIREQVPATLNINDNNFTDAELFTISGDHVNDEWYTSAVKITPMHSTFTKMSINGETATTGAQTYPKSGEIDGNTTVNLTFTNSNGSSVTKNGVPIKIDSVKPSFSIVAKSNSVDYTSGSSTMYDIEVDFAAKNTNISNVVYYYTKDVLSNGNVKPNANWIECGKFTISETATYYMKAVSGAGLESGAQKFVAKIDKPDTSKQPTISVTSNGKPFVADGSTWTNNDVTFKLSGNTQGYEVCVSKDADRSVDCDDISDNWTTIDDEVNSIHSIRDDQDKTMYWFRNKLTGFQTTASPAYTVMIDSVVPDIPTITLTEKQNILMSLFARSSNPFHNKAVDVEISAQDASSGIASITYDISDMDGKVLKQNQSYTEVLTYEDTNIQLSAKAIDKAGNVSAITSPVEVKVDTIVPQISGINDGASYYVPYVFISYQDSGSGIDQSTTTYTNNETTEELGNNTLFNGKGDVSIHVQDMAGNSTDLSFEMLGLPEKTDCSTDSMALIDTVKAQYNDVKGHLNDSQKKEVLDWMAKASNSCSVTDPEHDVTVENPEAKIPENTVLVVDVITTTIEDVELPLKDNEEIKVAFDVYFKKGEVVFKDLEGSQMKVKLPLGAFKGAKGLRLLSVEEDGTAEDIVYVTEGEYAVFTTSELKRYAFVAEKSADPNINVDVDCDGKDDINIDVDGDGIPDINIDTTGDGKANYNIDIDGDNIPDINIGPIDWNPDKCTTTSCGKAYCTSTYYKPYLNIDSDNDQRPDINIDLNKDMEADINIDTDFDNIPDIDIDSDGDGKADINIDDDGDGKADRNLFEMSEWKPELNVDSPFKYDTMAGLKADSDGSDDDSSTSGKDQSDKDQNNKDQNNMVDITPTVKGNYTSGIGGAMTGERNSLPILFIMLCSSALILWRCSKRTS